MGTITNATKLTEELLEDFIGCCAGRDYDGLQFDLGIIPSAIHIGGVVLLYEVDQDGAIHKKIGCGAKEIYDYINEFGQTIARDMVCFQIAHEMGRMKQLKPEDYRGGLIESSDKFESRADAYAMYVLDFSKDYYEELLDNIIEAGSNSKDIATSKYVTERKEAAVDYVDEWDGKAEKLRKQITVWSEQILDQARIFRTPICDAASAV